MSTEYAKGDRVSYTVMYGVGNRTEYRTEYGHVTSVRPGGARNEPQATIAVENPEPGFTQYVKRYVTDIAMADTPQRRAWLAGRDAGELDAMATLDAGAVRFAAQREMPSNRDLWPAWLHGYGYGVSGAIGPIPGHCLSTVYGGGRPMRTELTRD